MNRTARNLVLATGFAAAALTATVAPANADGGQISLAPHTDPQGPVIVMPTPTPDPDPQPELPADDVNNPAPEPHPHPQPDPQPDGPGEITDVPDCTHGCGGGDVPDDKQGPNQGDEPTDDPAEDAPLDQGCFTGCDLPEEDPEVTSVAIPGGIDTPTRIDAGLGQNTEVSQPGDNAWPWFAAGLGVLGAAGAVSVAARRRA